MPQKIRLHLSYKGTHYQGWQKQTRTSQTIQSQLDQALEALFQTPIRSFGAGRTDAGVHALDQVVHFQIDKLTKNMDIVRGLNSFLPEDIKVQKAFRAPDDFHALSSAVKKTYLYKIVNRNTPCPLSFELKHWIQTPLDIKYLNLITQELLGKHDFKSFQNTGTDVPHTVRSLFQASWTLMPNDEVHFLVEGDGFLKQMVRNILGFLLHRHWERPHQVGAGAAYLKSLKRSSSFKTAAANGLYLLKVDYPEHLDIKCIKL